MTDDVELREDFLMLGAHLVQQLCSYLKLPSTSTALAQIYLHTFYSSSSSSGNTILTFPLLDMAMGSVLLAAKASENHRRVRDLVNMGYLLFHKLRRVDFVPLPYVCDAYFGWRERVTKAEILILRALDFTFSPLLPHGLLINYLRALDLLEMKKLCQKALNYVNDAFRSPRLAREPAECIACVCLYAACDDLRVELPREWHLVFDVSTDSLKSGLRLLDRIYKWRFNPSLPITPQELKIFGEEYEREMLYMEGRFREKRRRSSSPIPPPSPPEPNQLTSNQLTSNQITSNQITSTAQSLSTNDLIVKDQYASLYSDFSSSPSTPK